VGSYGCPKTQGRHSVRSVPIFQLVYGLEMLIPTPFTHILCAIFRVTTFTSTPWCCLPPPPPPNDNSSMSDGWLALRRTAMSPYRQSAFRGVFSGYLFHGARRLASNAPFFFPPFAAGEPAFPLPLMHSGRLTLHPAFAVPPPTLFICALFIVHCSLPSCSLGLDCVFTGYAVYTWAKATDHYNNSKQGHIDALKSSGDHHGH